MNRGRAPVRPRSASAAGSEGMRARSPLATAAPPVSTRREHRAVNQVHPATFLILPTNAGGHGELPRLESSTWLAIFGPATKMEVHRRIPLDVGNCVSENYMLIPAWTLANAFSSPNV
jgi:hypothetical protein